MSQERTEAVVMRGVDFSETSRIVTFLSPVRGRLTCLARGAKRCKSPLSALLTTGNRVELVVYWKEGRGVQTLGEASLLDAFPAIRQDLDKSILSTFPLEIAYKIAHENEPSETLYATLARGLAQLADWNGDVRTHVCWQAIGLLAAGGFGLSPTVCAECGKPVTRHPRFLYDSGVTCSQCPSDRSVRELSWNALDEMVSRTAACPDVHGGEEVYHLVRRYAARQLETDLKSVRVIQEVLGV